VRLFHAYFAAHVFGFAVCGENLAIALRQPGTVSFPGADRSVARHIPKHALP